MPRSHTFLGPVGNCPGLGVKWTYQPLYSTQNEVNVDFFSDLTLPWTFPSSKCNMY